MELICDWTEDTTDEIEASADEMLLWIDEIEAGAGVVVPGAGAGVVVEEPALLTLEGVEITAEADVVEGGGWEGVVEATLGLVVVIAVEEGGRAVVVGAVTVTSVVTVVPGEACQFSQKTICRHVILPVAGPLLPTTPTPPSPAVVVVAVPFPPACLFTNSLWAISTTLLAKAGLSLCTASMAILAFSYTPRPKAGCSSESSSRRAWPSC